MVRPSAADAPHAASHAVPARHGPRARRPRVRARVLASVALALGAGGAVAAPPDKAWINAYTGLPSTFSYAKGVSTDGAGNVLVCGETATLTARDAVVLKYSPAGELLWEYRRPMLDSGDQLFVVRADGAGDVFACGMVKFGATFHDYGVVKLDGDTGAPIWIARYDGPGSNLDAALDMVLDSGGNPVVTGQSWSNETGYDIATVKFSGATGAALWASRANGSGSDPDGYAQDAGLAIALGPADSVAVTGWFQVGYNPSDEFNIYGYAGVKYNADGTEAWSTTYGDENTYGQASGVAVDANGDVFLTGGFFTGSDSGYGTVKLNGSDGGLLWDNLYTGPVGSGGTAYALALGLDGNPVVTGGTCAGIGFCNESFGTIALYGADGSLLWQRTYTNSDPNTAGSSARAIAVGPNGDVAVAGFTSFFSGRPGEAVTAVYSPSGAERWVDSWLLSGSVSMNAVDVAFDGAGNVLTASQRARPASNSDIVAAKYLVCAADFNQDGVVDSDDFFDFLNAFNAGC